MDTPESSVDVSNPSFWEDRYQAGQTGWDLGRPAPAFEDLFASANRPAPGKIAVVGCGRGNDALYFARQGFSVTGFDFAPSAVAASQEAAKRQGLTAEFVQCDIFALPEPHVGAFDYVLEHACFCAIDVARRQEYVAAVRSLLRPGGTLIGLFFAHGRPGGPPFTTDADEIHRLFDRSFEIQILQPATSSPEQRRGNELFGLMVRR